ncbi:Hypothetical predicted protein [Mytilus galloprovincialis]|uniref:Fibronectin type-III domain-containing protein n=1 Tax=Mytilus galloprovincialis TaxID=29158 RepID=A0A8B6G1F8_MYTGA|nr:Hypothetical predicted protein [Mytilus galloprovincialis]
MVNNAREENYTQYSEGHSLNSKIKNSNIVINGDNIIGKYNLIIRNVSAVDVGSYRCKFWKAGDLHLHIYVYNLQLQPLFPPIFSNGNKPIQFGRYAQKMNLTVLMNNKFGTIQTYYISKQNETLDIQGRQEKIKLHDIVQDVNVTVSGIKIIFQLTLYTAEDFTDYTIKACNQKGCNELTVKVKSEYRPQPPTNVSVIPFERYLTISWCPGYDGGYPQTFFIEYKTEYEKKWRRSGRSVFALGNEKTRMTALLYAISPYTRYHVRVISKNEIGESDTTVVTVMTLGDYSSVTKSLSIQRIAILLLIIITVMGAGFGIFVCKKITSETSSDGNENDHYTDIVVDDDPQTTSQEKDNPIMSTVNIICNKEIALMSSGHLLVSSDDNINDIINYDADYEQPYTTLVLDNRGDDEHVYCPIKDNSNHAMYENLPPFEIAACRMSFEYINQDTLWYKPFQHYYENADQGNANPSIIDDD